MSHNTPHTGVPHNCDYPSSAGWLTRFLRLVMLLPVRAYQSVISPGIPARCKYYPTCSQYAVDAVRRFGVIRGTILAAWRLLRCNPFSDGGVDLAEDQRVFVGRPCRRGVVG